jgi:hypothetical protein
LVARIVSYRIKDALAVVAKFKDEYFAEGATSFITKDEESSGIIDVTEHLLQRASPTRIGTTCMWPKYMGLLQMHVRTLLLEIQPFQRQLKVGSGTS